MKILFALVTMLTMAAGCAPAGPRAVVPGVDRCEHCRMTLADERFAAQLVTSTGKVLVFDEAGCLAAAVHASMVPADRVHSFWVADFRSPGAWLPAGEATFVRAPTLGTPMASGIVALGARADAEALADDVGGELLQWRDVLQAAARGER